MDNRKIELLKEALNEHNNAKRHPALLPAFYTTIAALLFISAMYGVSVVKRVDLIQTNLELESQLLNNSKIGDELVPATYSTYDLIDPVVDNCAGLIQSVDGATFCQSI